MESVMFLPLQEDASLLFVEGEHNPDELAKKSNVWVSGAGSAMLPQGMYKILEQQNWVWMVIQAGNCTIKLDGVTLHLKGRECFTIPPRAGEGSLEISQETRAIWFTVDGSLAPEFLKQMGAIQHRPMKHGALPSQMKLARHIVQSTVRIAASSEGVSAQLQQLLWGMLASHSGQPIAMDVVLSHEIAKVVDAMRKNQYKDSFTLSDMANISRMPVETFRKRFVSEVGMPPQSYQLFCKMERAKTLLKQGKTVKQTGIEVGMTDQYHFSKTFKNIVGMSPSMYCKTTQE